MTAHHFVILIVAAIAEIVGCYLMHLYFRRSYSMSLLLPAAASFVLFAWLLSTVTSVPGRTYAIYGIVYVATALLWLWVVDDVELLPQDVVGATVAIGGMALIASGHRHSA